MLGKTSVSDLSEHVFDLILELYNIDSHLLLSVLPQLEFKLKVLKKHFLHHNVGLYMFLICFNIKRNCLTKRLASKRGIETCNLSIYVG